MKGQKRMFAPARFASRCGLSKDLLRVVHLRVTQAQNLFTINHSGLNHQGGSVLESMDFTFPISPFN